MKRDAWVEAHPYLQRVARFTAQVEAAADAAVAPAQAPRWEDYASDFGAGVPLLASHEAALDLERAGAAVVALVAKLATSPLDEPLRERTRALDVELRRERDAARRTIDWLLEGADLASSSPGLLRYFAWSALARHLRPVVAAFDARREEEHWLRNYCPTCGSPPAMAQLVGVDPARVRHLACGRCATRWRFKRTACPFCEFDADRLTVLAIEGEPRLRIDHCESCKGYLKTYAGQGDEHVFLADWTSLHLDLLARDRGLERRAASLYEIDELASA